MYRCVAAAAAVLFLVAPASAQQRQFPQNALRGALQFVEPPEILLNGQPARLAPGVRIRGQNNMLVLSGALSGSKLLVHYTVDMGALVKDVWILTPEEATKRPWPTTPREAESWSFDTVAQTWSKP